MADPSGVPALVADLLNEAIALHQSNQLDQAALLYQKILSLDEDNVEALHFLAIALQSTGKAHDAVGYIKRALSIQEGDPAVQLAATRIFYDTQKWADCLAAADQTLSAVPDYHEVALMKVAALMALQRFAEAVDPARRLMDSFPEDKDINNFYIRILLAVDNVERAVANAQNMHLLFPHDAEMTCTLALCLKKGNRALEAEKLLVGLLESQPENFNALNELGDLYFTRGDTATALDLMRKSHAVQPFNTYAMSRICFYSAFDHRADAEEMYRINRAYSEHLMEGAKSHVLPDPPKPHDDGKIHIGILANDFNNNVTSWFLEPVLSRYDKSRFHVTCYSGVDRPDEVTNKLSDLVDEWRTVQQVDVVGAADQIRGDGIDILVLASFYRGEDRCVLAHRIAPVQVGYHNRVASTALDTVDYIFTEELLDPTGKVEHCYTESPVRITIQNCYLPTKNAPDPAPPPCLENGFITFGSFNNLSKINIDVIRTWSDLLHKIPDSRLLLRYSKYFDIPGTREFFRDRFVSFGMDPERLIFQGNRETRRDHLLGMQEADIALDPFPCNGGTTSRESLLLGLPLITMHCDTFMGRQGLSYLSKLGLTDMIANSPSEYVEIGKSLASDFSRIQALRSSLPPLVEDKLLNYEQHVVELEAAFTHMWARHLSGQPHTPFYVTDGDVTDSPK